MKVIAVNDKGRPNEIPLSKWIKKDEIYTVEEAMKCTVQGGLLGYKLAEIDLSGCFPYLYFAANRFRPIQETPDMEEVNELELIA